MDPRWFVLAEEDFGKPITLSRVDDLLESQAEGDVTAEEGIKLGCQKVYLFRLERVYIPSSSRMVETVMVDAGNNSESFGGTSDD